MRDLTVSVADVIDRPGQYRDVHIAADLPGVANALVSLQERPVAARLRLESVVEGVLVTGRVEGVTRFSCARCLAERSGWVSLDVCEMFVADMVGSSDDEAYPLAGLEIDLEPMLRDALTLALPLRPLCRASCKGLCPTCGVDLNLGSCVCRDDAVDPRWAALGELRERLES